MKIFILMALLLYNGAFAQELKVDKDKVVELASIMNEYETLRRDPITLPFLHRELADAERRLKRYELFVEFERVRVEAELILDELFVNATATTDNKEFHYALELQDKIWKVESALEVILSPESRDMPSLDVSLYEDSFNINVSLFYLNLEAGFPGLWDYDNSNE